RVGAQNFGEIVEDLNRVVDLILGKWIDPCRELVRGDTRNTFEARRQHYYARSICTRRNSERACLWTNTPCGLRIGRFARVVDPKFINSSRGESLRVTDFALLRVYDFFGCIAWQAYEEIRAGNSELNVDIVCK